MNSRAKPVNPPVRKAPVAAPAKPASAAAGADAGSDADAPARARSNNYFRKNRTPLARDELNGVNGAGYRRMIELAPAGRAGTPDEIGAVGELLMTARGAFITGSDILIDGGSTASFFYGPLSEHAPTPKDGK